MDTRAEIMRLLEQLKGIVARNMAAKNRIASGNTIADMECVMVADDEGQILVPPHFRYVEAGAAPTSRGAKPWPQRYKVIHEWAKQKHIISDDSPASKRISGAIATKIKNEGTKAWRMGGQDVFTSEIDAAIFEMVDYDVANLIRLNR